LHQCDVTAHSFVLGNTVQLHPCFVLGGAHKVEETWLGPTQITSEPCL
jgi:hypothetical protein